MGNFEEKTRFDMGEASFIIFSKEINPDMD